MTLREKVAECAALAMEARMKAGPMWKNGKPATPEELGEKWHRWTPVAKGHEAEQMRLLRLISDAKERGQ